MCLSRTRRRSPSSRLLRFGGRGPSRRHMPPNGRTTVASGLESWRYQPNLLAQQWHLCRRSHEGANATGHAMAQQQQLCCTPATTITVVCTEALVRCSPVGGITTTIVVLMGRRHRSIAPTRNNNPASQPNHIRIAQRVNHISGRGGAERGIPDRVRGPERQKGLSIRTHQPCPMTCSRGCLNQLAWCGFGCHPDQTRAEGTLFAIMRSAWPGGEAEAEAEAAGVSLRLGERQ